jgi:hypothetical protein
MLDAHIRWNPFYFQIVYRIPQAYSVCILETRRIRNPENILHSTLLSILQIFQRLLHALQTSRPDFKWMAVEFARMPRPRKPATCYKPQIASIRPISPVFLIMNDANVGGGPGRRSHIKVTRQNEVDSPVRRHDLRQHLLTRDSDSRIDSVVHFTVVSSLEMRADLTYCFVDAVAVVDDCVAFGAIQKRFHVVGALACNCDDGVDVAVAGEFDGI